MSSRVLGFTALQMPVYQNDDRVCETCCFPSCVETMPRDEKEWSRQKQKPFSFLDVRGLYGRADIALKLDFVALLGNACTGDAEP